MKSLYKILSEKIEASEKYFKNIEFYGKEIKKIINEILPCSRVLFFGSAIRKDYFKGSDIDVLIISENIPSDSFRRAEIVIKIKEIFPDNPFQFHFATPEEYEFWYKKFIKNDYKEF